MNLEIRKRLFKTGGVWTWEYTVQNQTCGVQHFMEEEANQGGTIEKKTTACV